jgi:hypothetical protein
MNSVFKSPESARAVRERYLEILKHCRISSDSLHSSTIAFAFAW